MRRVEGDGEQWLSSSAILAVVLFGFAALVIDVGALYHERRQLQNGADAGAFAVAQACADGACGTFTADADGFADGNAVDGARRIPAGGVCGSATSGCRPASIRRLAWPGRATCGSPPGPRPRAAPRSSRPSSARIVDPATTGRTSPHPPRSCWGAPSTVKPTCAHVLDLRVRPAVRRTRPATRCSPPSRTARAPVSSGSSTSTTRPKPAMPRRTQRSRSPRRLRLAGLERQLRSHHRERLGGRRYRRISIQRLQGRARGEPWQDASIPVFNATNGLNGSNGKYQILDSVGFVLTGWQVPWHEQASSTGPARTTPARTRRPASAASSCRTSTPDRSCRQRTRHGLRVTQLVR